jgi:tetratricopeptide (TPR) repeat protein
LGSSGLVGRESEVERLRAVIEGAPEQGSVTLLIGEPGIGKSALLRVARDAALEAGYTLLGAEGVENEMHLPFGGLQQLVAPLMGSTDELPPTHRHALETAIGLSSRSRPDLFLIAEAAFNLIVVGRRLGPVIIVADDVQWLDPQSHQILAFLAHRSVVGRFCVLGAIRTDHPGPLADVDFPKLVVQRLDDQTAERMLQSHSGLFHANDLRRIREEAAGNPLALLELPRSWGTGPPTSDHTPALSARLEHAFAGRVSGLSSETQDALLLAAVSSSSDTSEISAALEAFSGSPLSPRVLEPAIAAGLITEASLNITFRHPLVRSGILHRESFERRHAAHRALADVLVADRYRQSWHRAWSIVGPDDDVAEDLAATVPNSLQRGAVMSAVSSLERSAQLTTSPTRRGERLLLSANYAFGAGRADVVARILRDASEVDLTELDQARCTWLTEALNEDVAANSDCVRKLAQSAEVAKSFGDKGLGLDLLLSAALRIWWADSGTEDRKRVLDVLDRFTEAIEDPRHVAAVAITEPILRSTEVHDRLRAVNFDELDDGDALRMYGMAAYGIGNYPLADHLLERAEKIFRSQGRLGLLPVVLALQVHIRIDLGDWSAATAATDEVYSISRETGQALFAQTNFLVEARALALRGKAESALELMSSAESEATQRRCDDRICLGYQARGAALLSADRPEEAFTCLRRQYDPADPGYHLRESIGALALMVEAAVDSQQSDQARQIIESFEILFLVAPSPLLEVNLLYARAVLAPNDLRDPLYQAAMDHDLADWPWIRGRVLLEYGRWLLRSGRPRRALAHLAEAQAVFDRIGAERWSRKASAALDYLDDGRSGSPPQDGLP